MASDASIAYKLASCGANVALIHSSPNSEPLVRDVERNITSLPHKPKILCIREDLRQVGAASKIVEQLAQWLAEKDFKIHITVKNAGVELVNSLEDITAADFETVYSLNVRVPLLLTQALLPHIPPASRVINIGSVGSRAGSPKMSLCCSSKAALEGLGVLTRYWAAELGHNGTVNVANAGPVQTEMLDNISRDILDAQKKGTPVENRLGTREEVADVVAFLAGPNSMWVTGQTLSISGGWAMY